MDVQHRILDFRAVDDLAFAGEKGRLDRVPANVCFTANALGPLLEVRQLRASKTLPDGQLPWLDAGALTRLDQALRSGAREWFGEADASGLLRLEAEPRPVEWTNFAMRMKRAGVAAGLSSEWAAQMAAALREMESNIGEHSGAPASGVLAYRTVPGRLEFVATDTGRGVLATLREAPDYATLVDHGEALRLTLTDGASRLGAGLGRGYGFRPLFTGLANRNGALRFRSGSAALIIDGSSPSLIHAQVTSKATVTGLFVSVVCSVGSACAT